MTQSSDSEERLRADLSRRPTDTRMRLQLVARLLHRQAWVEAEQVLAQGIQSGDSSPQLWMQHGEVLLDLHRPAEAVERFRQVLQAVPDHADAMASLGGALLQIGDVASAAQWLERAASHLPDDPLVWELWGESLAHADQTQDAVRVYGRAWQLGARQSAIAWYLGNTACDQGRFAQAVQWFQQGIALGGTPIPWHNLGKAYFELGDVSAATKALRAGLEQHEAEDLQLLALRNLALMIPGDPLATPTEVAQVRQQYAKRMSLGLPEWQPSARRLDLAAPLRVGYVSSFFAHANYMKPVYAVLRAHDPARVRVELFHDGPASPALEACVENSAVEVVHEVTRLSNLQLVHLIRERRLDVVVDLNAFSAMHRLPIYTQPLAPVGVGWFNHYATSALPAMDALIGDAQTYDIAEASQFSERVVCLPVSYLAFRVTHAAPELVPPPCLTRGYLTFGSLCTQYKITPEVLRVWGRLLCEVPNSRLLLANRTLEATDVQAYVQAAFRGEGVDSDRLILRGGGTHMEYLQNYNEMDVALDAWPYNGGTTTTEALWQGVPVLAFRGDRWASLTSASLLAESPFRDFLRSSLDDMLQFAIQLATDPATPQQLQQRRASARSDLEQSPVCAVAKLAQSLEDAYWSLAVDRGGGA